MDAGLWTRALYHLDKGNFSRLEELLGGPNGFDRQIAAWHDEGRFVGHEGLLAEALTCACMLGRVKTAEYLLDNNVDPHVGTRTGLNGFHYAASSGHLDVITLLIDRGVSMEVENNYGGTVLGQALWSAVNEHRPAHAEVIELLVDAGAVIEAGTIDWWSEQHVPDTETRQRVLDVLRRHRAE